MADFEKIARIMLGKMADHLLERGIKMNYTSPVLKLIAKESFSETFGARNMRRYIEKNVEDKVAELILSSYPKKLTGISISVLDGELKFDHI